jgi:hypothetical protein
MSPQLVRAANITAGYSGVIVMVFASHSYNTDGEIYENYDDTVTDMVSSYQGDEVVMLIGIKRHPTTYYEENYGVSIVTGLDKLKPSGDTFPEKVHTAELSVEPEYGPTLYDGIHHYSAISTVLTENDFLSWYITAKSALGHTPKAVYLIFQHSDTYDQDVLPFFLYGEHNTGSVDAYHMFSDQIDDPYPGDNGSAFGAPKNEFIDTLKKKQISVNTYEEWFGKYYQGVMPRGWYDIPFNVDDNLFLFYARWPLAVKRCLDDFYGEEE